MNKLVVTCLLVLLVLIAVICLFSSSENATFDSVTSALPGDATFDNVSSAPPDEAAQPWEEAAMDEPPMDDGEGLDTNLEPESANGDDDANYTKVKVFYGTNRTRTGSDKPHEYFGNESARLTYGSCEVSIPRDHEMGELEAPFMRSLLRG